VHVSPYNPQKKRKAVIPGLSANDLSRLLSSDLARLIWWALVIVKEEM